MPIGTGWSPLGCLRHRQLELILAIHGGSGDAARCSTYNGIEDDQKQQVVAWDQPWRPGVRVMVSAAQQCANPSLCLRQAAALTRTLHDLALLFVLLRVQGEQI